MLRVALVATLLMLASFALCAPAISILETERPSPDDLVIRWEFLPGSTLYLAWQQARSDYAQGIGDFDFGRDRRALFRARPDNVFVLKLNYWLTP